MDLDLVKVVKKRRKNGSCPPPEDLEDSVVVTVSVPSIAVHTLASPTVPPTLTTTAPSVTTHSTLVVVSQTLPSVVSQTVPSVATSVAPSVAALTKAPCVAPTVLVTVPLAVSSVAIHTATTIDGDEGTLYKESAEV